MALPINSSSLLSTNKNEQRMIEIETTDLIFPTKPSMTKKPSPANVVDDTEDDDDSSTATETESEDSSLDGNCSDGSDEWQTTILDPPEKGARTTTISTCSNNNGAASNGKKVSFGILEFRKYGMTLGDHPDCLMGPPVRYSSGMLPG